MRANMTAVARNGRKTLRRIGAKFLDKILDYFVPIVLTFVFALATAVGGAAYHRLAHRRIVVSLLVALAIGLFLGLVAAAIRAVRDATKRARYLEAQKQLIYDALESIQQAVAIEEDWALNELVERGVLGPVRGLLMRARFEDVRLSVLVPAADDDGYLVMRWAAGHSPEGVRNYRRPVDVSYAGQAYREGELVVRADVLDDPQFIPNPRAQREFRSLVAFPVRLNEDVVGVLVAVSTEPNAFVDTDISFIKVVAALVDVLLAAEHDARSWQEYADEQRRQGAADAPPPDGTGEDQETPAGG